MSPGGHDIVFRIPAVLQSGALETAATILSGPWGEACFQDADTGRIYPKESKFPFDEVDELLIYRDAEALHAWDEQGLTDETRGSMFHVLLRTGQLTVVVDDPEESAALLGDIRRALETP